MRTEGDLIKINDWLLPLSWIYGGMVRFRNWLFDIGLKKSQSFSIPIISVGNITVGGSGKTPHVEYLIRLLHDKVKIAVLSRGYKRKTSGYVLADKDTTMSEIGDEPFQMHSKFDDIYVAVDAKRVRGIEKLQNEEPTKDVDVVLLDDAFQHRYVKPGINILLVDYHRLIIYDKMLPAGRLREPLSGKSRADIVIITKCPKDLKPMEFRVLTKAMDLYPFQKLYFTCINYDTPKGVFEDQQIAKEELKNYHALLVTGIASPKQMEHDLKPMVKSMQSLSFGDHHRFKNKDITRINEAFEQMPEPRLIITTEKDAVRLKETDGLYEIVKKSIYELPIKVSFMLEQEDIFNDKIISYVRKIQETASWLKERMTTSPKTAIILGTGLGQLASEITDSYEFPYSEIPNFPVSTVQGHAGKLIFGKLGGKDIMAMEGRFHYYEGYDMKAVTFPERVMYELGIETLFVSNASGGMNPEFQIGDLMIIDDHINFFPEHPLRGKNFPTGPRFPDMHEAYDKKLRDLADDIAKEKGIDAKHGVYVGVQGPTFETPAEYRMYRVLGGDAVGMSTVPEVIVARHCGIKVFGISIITDLGGFDVPVEVSHEEVQIAANAAQPKMTEIMREIIRRS